MALKRAAALCFALFILLSLAVCPSMHTVSAASEKDIPSELPLSLSGTSKDRMYFLPVYEKAVSFDPIRDVSLLLRVNSAEAEFIPLSYALPESLPSPVLDILVGESICPRAP